jgi:hypothetical protein
MLKLSVKVAVLLFFSLAAFADSKVTTRNTVMGMTTEGTTYIKGARERSETNLPMNMGKSVTIIQCDQKRIITINPANNTCMVMPMDWSEAAGGPKAAAAYAAESSTTEAGAGPPRKGGTVTFTSTANDTGERQKMFGVTARHVKSRMSAEASPDACSPGGMNMERDGWYADIAPALACRSHWAGATQALQQHRQRAGCQDKIQFKGSMANLGYPLKETMTMNASGHEFSMTTEVTDLSTATLDAALFDMPAGCKVVTSAQEMMASPKMPGGMPPGMPPIGQQQGNTQVAEAKPVGPAPKTAAPAVAPKTEPAPTVAPKTEGVVRVGIVKIKDATGQYLPTDNLRINLMGEITKRSLEAVPLDAETPTEAVMLEAQQKQCDYVLYTAAEQVGEPGKALAMPAALRTVKLDANKYQALLAMTLYKVGKPAPELKEVTLAADADQFGVNAVMAGFEKEADKAAEQVKKDSEQKRPTPAAAKRPAKK